jgi:Zn-dependent protease/CBS domain-containing protein
VEENVRLGRVAGIPVGMNWSVLVIVWLLAWSLASQYLPDARPGYAPGAYWAVGAVSAVLLVASLLAHELGHALVARRHDVGVEGITLWLFGGVSRLERDPPDPGSDLRIAVAGPAVSFGLALGALVVALSLSTLGASPLVVAAAGWLATINAVLGVFNLMPAAPLDGGRVLRAAVWRRTGDRRRASSVATSAGRAFGFLLVALGVLQFAAGIWVGGIWFVFLGLFLVNAARAEQFQTVLADALEGITAAQVMSRDPITVPGTTTVAELIDHVLVTHRCSSFPVVGPDGRVNGLVTLGHVRAVPATERAATTVGAIATPIARVATGRVDEPALEVIGRAARTADRRALLFDDGGLAGIITPTDVMRLSEYAMVRA